MIINLHKNLLIEKPGITYKEITKELSEKSGVGLTSIQRILAEYKSTKTVKSPKMTKVRIKLFDTIDDFHKTVIRKKVQTFWFNRELPTLQKVLSVVAEDKSLPTLKRSSMYKLLKELKFVFTRRKQNSVLRDRDDLIICRRNYLKDIRQYREEGRTIYYLDETWYNVGECEQKACFSGTIKSKRDAFQKELSTGVGNSTEKGKHLIMLHVASNKGFVEGGLLCLESNTNSIDYLHEMDGATFLEWFQKILPLLDENSIIVLDSAPYHCEKQIKYPTSTWKRSEIAQWLLSKNIDFDCSFVKAELIQMVKSHKKQHDRYVLDEIARSQNKTLLRLPPFHCELNPIQLAWSMVKSFVKSNNSTFKINDVKQLLIDGVNQITSEHWSSFEKSTIDEEHKFWDIDIIVDDMIDNMDTDNFAVGNSSSSSDNEDN